LRFDSVLAANNQIQIKMKNLNLVNCLIGLGVVIVISVFIGIITLNVCSARHTSIVYDCKVMELQQQQLIKGSGNDMKTEIRYLVITDKETFICESSILNGKFNNSDIFWRLEKGKTYKFRVSGYGKSMFLDYRNILEVL